MKTRTCTSSAPAMPAVWPQKRPAKPVKRRFPHTVDEPRSIGYYLGPLCNIAAQPDRNELLKAYLKENYV